MSGETLTLFEAAETQGVPPGYKQTEVGVIPEGWSVKRLEEMSFIATGSTPSTEVQALAGTPCRHSPAATGSSTPL